MQRFYKCRVERHQIWKFEVEARSIEEAKDKADELACSEPAHDDYAYDTEAEEIP